MKFREGFKGNFLNKSTGLIALMKFLRPVNNSLKKQDEVIKYDVFKPIFDSTEIVDNSFSKDVYIPGTSGQSALLSKLKAKSGIIYCATKSTNGQHGICFYADRRIYFQLHIAYEKKYYNFLSEKNFVSM